MNQGNFMPGKAIVLKDLLKLNVEKSTLRVKNRESEHREFKLEFYNKNLPKFAKAMAAFANKDGGVLFFGIKDKPRELVGANEKDIPDDVVFTNFLKEYFQPEIHFQSETISLNGKKIHTLMVSESVTKPVICKKSKTIKSGNGEKDIGVLREGAVYYRYSASSDEIKYADLFNLLESEKQSYFRSMVDNLTLLNKVGLDKAAVVNAEDLAASDKSASVFLTNETAQNLNWVESGRFTEDESEGSKAFYVVRKVEIKQGIEVEKPTDYAKSHPLTKADLTKSVKLYGADFDAVIWKLGIKDNPKYHFSSTHGKNKIHKFTKSCKKMILDIYPLTMPMRKETVKALLEEYNSALR